MLRKILLVIILLSNSCAATARWATFADAPIEILDGNLQISVQADGSFVMHVTKQIKILNERGREANAKVALTYNFDNSKLEILQAKTIVDNQEYNLNSNLIEDKPLASEIQGFDQSHQVLLAFPNVKVGAILYLEYKLSVLKADIAGFFEYMQEYADNFISKSDVHIESALPLYINTNDPGNYLTVTQGNTGKLHTLDIKLEKPIYINVVDEKPAPLNPKKYPWVFVATSDNWMQFAQKYAEAYLKVLQQPLPPVYQQIAVEAKQLPDPIKQIELVAARLNEHVQYMGDWKTTDGRHVPQNLLDVTNKRLGDCKDFATGMVAILQQLGMKANVALVQRGQGVYDTNMIKLPGAFHFNHAMVRVQLANNKVLWVDPTNFYSIADKVLPDIADRQVVVLAANDSHLENIPQSNPQDDVIISKKTLDLKNTDVANVKATLTLRGLGALNLTGAGLQVAQETINNAIIYQLGNYDNIIDKKVISPKLDSRIVADLTFEVDYKEKNMLINTNAGKALIITNPIIDHFIFNPEQVADLYLGAPKTLQRSITLTNINVANTDVLDYTLQSPWVDVIRTVKYKTDSVTVDQKIIIKTSWLYDDEVKSAQYQAFVAELAQNFKDGVAIIFNK